MGNAGIIVLVMVVTASLVAAGCMQVSGTSPLSPAVPQAVVPAPEPATPVPAAVTTSVPREVVTVIHYVSPPRDLRDSTLLFALQAPAEWNVSTWRLTKSDTSDYRTDLVAGNVFTIVSYPGSGSREQEFRDRFRQWSPAPAETAVTINGIRYDRYESSADGNTTVAYLARTNSANERGYVSVLIFTARDSNRFEREDYEKVVSSFRYFSIRSAGSVPGEVIPMYSVGGNAAPGTVAGSPRADTSDWDTGNTYSGGAPSEDTSSGPSGGGSSGGCHR